MHRIIFLIVALFPILGQSQCLCADIEFDLKLKGLKFEKGNSNYSMKVLKPNNLKTVNSVIIKEKRIDKNNLSFSFPTNGGINILEFVIRNHTNNKEMHITVSNMTYDNSYYIDLLTFRKGSYSFDWNEISKCQRGNQTENLIECNGKKIYQIKLKSEKEHFIHNKIRPKRIKDFKV